MRRLTWFPKYVLGPALAAALGFWLIGPRLAGDPKVQKMIKERASQMAASSESPASEGSTSEAEKPAESTPASLAPQVTVGVKPVSEEVKPAATKPRSSRSKRRRRRRPRSTSTAHAAPTAPPTSTAGP